MSGYPGDECVAVVNIVNVIISLNDHLLISLELLKGNDCVGNDCENKSLLPHMNGDCNIGVAVLPHTQTHDSHSTQNMCRTEFDDEHLYTT